MLDLILPLQCGGCGAPATRWCSECGSSLAVRPDEPHLVTPRLDPGVPVLSLGRYAGPRRKAIVAVKEHGRTDLIHPLACALRDGLEHLLTWGIVEAPCTVVPAPTKRTSARKRGGDPVTRIARLATTATDLHVVDALRLTAFARDSVGLSSADRQRNITGRVRPVAAVTGPVLLVDDVVTTGATAAESVRVLQTRAAHVVAVLALANA